MDLLRVLRIGIQVSGDAIVKSDTERDEEILALFAAHAAIALTNARLYERSRELSVITERARLARELHDAVTQKLFSIRAHARAAAVLAGRDPVDAGRVRAEIEVVGELGAEAHAELRAVIDGLAPPDLEAAGLAESLRRYAVLAGRAHGVPVTFTAACLPPLDSKAEAAFYRVAQEALHNATKHSGVKRIGVQLREDSGEIHLIIRDSGKGFDVEAALQGKGLGLTSMRERVRLVNGTSAVESKPMGGTTSHIRVPLGLEQDSPRAVG